MSDEQKPDPLDVLTEPAHRERMAELRWVAGYGLDGPKALARSTLDLILSLCSRVQQAETKLTNYCDNYGQLAHEHAILEAQLETITKERDGARVVARELSGSRSNVIHQLDDAEKRLVAEQLRAGRLSIRAEQAEVWFLEAKECVESSIDTDDESERGIQLHMAASRLWQGLCALRGVDPVTALAELAAERKEGSDG